MTRFARAKGSKSSNERIPQQATSWQQMKQQMEDKKQEILENKNRAEFEKVRKSNYQAFLEEKDNDVHPKWAEFEGVSSTKQTGEKKVKKKSKNNKEIADKNEAGGEKFKLQELIDKIENVLDKGDVEKGSEKKKKKVKNKQIHKDDTDLQENNTADSDDAPEEMSSKSTSKMNKVKLPKKVKLNKKVTLIIPPVLNNDNEAINANNVIKENDGSENKEVNKKKLKTNKNSDKNKANGQVKPKKAIEDMTEEEIQKLNKKREKRMRQFERRKKFKAEQREKALREEQQDNGNMKKRKLPKERDDKEHKRRKPNNQPTTFNINGVNIEIDYCDGFPVKKEDAERLSKLRKEMISKGIPRNEVRIALKLERRKAEKALARERKKVCYNCRKSGHVLSECPNLNDESSHQEMTGTGICFKCGSTEHTHFECKVVRNDDFRFATCFICKEQGHISRQCPDNQRGMYPKGGACKVCGDVTHLKKDCPKFQDEQELQTIKLDTVEFGNVESLPEEKRSAKKREGNKSNKVVKF